MIPFELTHQIGGSDTGFELVGALIPAAIGLVGVLVGAGVSNAGQQRRDLQVAAQATRDAVLLGVSSTTAYLGSVGSLIEMGLTGDASESALRETVRVTDDRFSTALKDVVVLLGTNDEEVAKQGAKLHSELSICSNLLIPIVRYQDWSEARAALDARLPFLEREYNVLLFMVQARERLQTGSWIGHPFFRSRAQGNSVYDGLR
jgi:hypothetical protein